MSQSDWKTKAAEKLRAVRSGIPPEWRLTEDEIKHHSKDIMAAPEQILSSEAFKITEIESGVALARQLASGAVSAEDVARAFMHRAAIASQLTNCTTEIFFDKGLKRARDLDQFFAQNGKTVGPFHGLPISLKDCFNVEGVDSTLGYTEQIGNASELEQSALTNMLFDLGAVIYVKTNIPQLLMTADSENNVFGRTLNPNNPKLSAGGLSGGEGALVKQRGSIIGVGTDIAGSIRIPSLCCGTYGFMPSTARVPYLKQNNVVDKNHLGFYPTAGPLARSYEDLRFFFENVISAKPWTYDYDVLNIPYVPAKVEDKLVLGVIFEDPHLPVHPPVKANIEAAVKKLEAAGHTVIRIEKFPDIEDAWRIAMNHLAIAIDGEKNPMEPFFRAGEPIIKSLSQNGMNFYVKDPPNTLQKAVSWFRKRADFKLAWHDIFVGHKLDALIAPGAPSSAPPHDTYGISPYTCVWNLVDYPAIEIPFGVIEGHYDEDLSRYPEHLKGMYAFYDEKTYDGGLGSLQIVAPNLQDEKLLAVGEIIDRVLNK